MMPKRFLKRIWRGEEGITGLETAIILIAFVVVAAVFAYTVLSAGLFSTQKGQEAVYSGLKEAQSTLELKGSVIAMGNSTGRTGEVKQVVFTLSNVLGGEAIDFTPPTAGSATGIAADDSENVVIINYIDQYQRVENLYWTIDKIGGCDDDDLLEVNEKFQVTVGNATAGSGGGNLINALTNGLGVNTKFDLEMLTPAGAVLVIERTIPANIDTVMNLH